MTQGTNTHRVSRNATVATTTQRRCLHCAHALHSGNVGNFCCAGCAKAFDFLNSASLNRFYDLRRGTGLAQSASEHRYLDHKWLEAIEDSWSQLEEPRSIALDIQGMHCAACAWLVDELFQRKAATSPGHIVINPARGEVHLTIDRSFPLAEWVADVERAGYVLQPSGEKAPPTSDALLIRLGICLALAANTMIFAAATYLGLRSGPVYELLNQLTYAAGVVSVAVGGSVFIGSAARALSRRILHLDVPIAAGILLAFAGASWSFFTSGGHPAYIDTLTVFIALMLLGRWLQRRMLERNRAVLMADQGTERLLVRRITHGSVQIVPCSGIAEGDVMLVAPGELVPVEGRLQQQSATLSLDWIDGESRPREFENGDKVPAGSFNAGNYALQIQATTDFSDSAVVHILTRNANDGIDEPLTSRWWTRVSRWYVVGILGLATVGVIAWFLLTRDVTKALEVGTAVLIVTCPCAFGIAAPLAYEFAHAQLRRLGLFVRTADFLDRIRSVTRIVFDKTGTLTTGTLEVADSSPLERLKKNDAVRLYNLVARSRHPKSDAIRRALEALGMDQARDIEVRESFGFGLEAVDDGERLRVGAASWADPTSHTEPRRAVDTTDDVVFSVNEQPRAKLEIGERARPQSDEELNALRQRGYELTILSGDAEPRVAALAEALQFERGAWLGEQSPDQKAAYVKTHTPEHTLFVGDGLNDHAAMDAACCAGTPSINQPFTATRCDFFFSSPGLGLIGRAIETAETIGRVVRRILVFAVIYNVVAVTVALAGLMQPWLAAVTMPISSLITIGYTIGAMSRSERP